MLFRKWDGAPRGMFEGDRNDGTETKKKNCLSQARQEFL